MKKLFVVMLLVGVLFSVGCAIQPRSYFIEAKIYPLSADEVEKMKENESAKTDNAETLDKEIYNCELQITEIMDEGKETETKNVICSPKLTFYKGQKANLSISDDEGTSGVSADVIVDDNEVTNIDVTIKEKGKTVSHSKMSVETKGN